MIVMSRKRNESIVINDDITIVIIDIRDDKVRIGIEAPKAVPVHRREIYEAIRGNQYPDDDEIANRSLGSAERLESKSVQPVSRLTQQDVARPTSESPQWQEVIGRGFRTVRGWINKLVEATVPAIAGPPVENLASEAPALEPRELIDVEPASQVLIEATDVAATQMKILDTSIAAPAEESATSPTFQKRAPKKRAPRKAAATQLTVKKASKKPAPKEAAVKKLPSKKSPAKKTAAKKAPASNDEELTKPVQMSRVTKARVKKKAAPKRKPKPK